MNVKLMENLHVTVLLLVAIPRIVLSTLLNLSKCRLLISTTVEAPIGVGILLGIYLYI